MVNISNDAYTIKAGERLAQMVIAQHEQASWKEVEVLDETQRGAGRIWKYWEKLIIDRLHLECLMD